MEMAYQIINESNALMDYSKNKDSENLEGTMRVALCPAYSYVFFDLMTRYEEHFPKVDFQLGIYPQARMKE